MNDMHRNSIIRTVSRLGSYYRRLRQLGPQHHGLFMRRIWIGLAIQSRLYSERMHDGSNWVGSDEE
jgi:hypothetical protein